ncbi:putative phage tail protein [Paenibacillus sp. UNC451MF]|uniref:putative phage tail protein n=1 Tax=Paenibacillus sp. UNC451MF TaxID=1449063 RepID=UPI00048BB7D1|nr:putative phage tail protein [Paenibacillus sp. UNC451MF]
MRDYPLVRMSMADYMPNYYRDSLVVDNLLDREASFIAHINTEMNEVLAQFYIDTATWGLTHWERICGIRTDSTKPNDQRRSVIKSKLRGIGTVTAKLIKDVAEAYVNGEVEVTENNTLYHITITFISTRGIPANLDDIQASLRMIIPAHIGINFEFTYLSWQELNALDWTWDDLDARKPTWNELETYRP